MKIQQNEGILQLSSSEQQDNSQQLSQAVIHLLEDKAAATLLGEQAHQVVLNNQGASARTLAQVQELML